MLPRNLSQAVGFLLGLWLALHLLLPLAAQAEPASARPAALAALEADLVASVNRYRAERHLIALKRRVDLDAVARAHSQDMARRGYLAHRSPEGHDWVQRLGVARVTGFAFAAENVGLTSKADPNAEILGGWIQSRVHRENLDARSFNATGVGIARAANGTLYYTQLYLTFPR